MGKSTIAHSYHKLLHTMKMIKPKLHVTHDKSHRHILLHVL